MITILTVIHVLVCLFLIVIVLLQHGKGADIGATFGGSSQTVFGSEGPLPLLNKITTASAIIFMVTSLILAQYSGQKSIMQGEKPAVAPQQQEQKVDTTPETVPVPEKGKAPQGSEFPVEKSH